MDCDLKSSDLEGDAILVRRNVPPSEEPITLEEFNKLHAKPEQKKQSMCDPKRFQGCCTKSRLLTGLKRVFPFVPIMRKYTLRDFLQDAIAGLTVCIMNIPQGMAYSRLAGLPPVYGLYTSMFPAVVYFFLGTSRHISIGTVVAVSLAIENAVSGVIKSPPSYISVQRVLGPDNTVLNETYTYNGREYTLEEMRLEITIALTLLTGFAHVILGVLRLGFFVAFFSEEMLHGFVAGLCIHLTTSQISFLVGYGPSKKYEGFFKLFFIYYDMIINFHKVNLVLLPLSIISVFGLFIFKEKIQPIISKRVKAPVPIDLVLIIVGILLGYFISLPEYKIETVGNVPSGLPSVKVPDVKLFPPLLVQGIFTAIIGYAETIAIAKPFALKHDYKLDSNQELIAIGSANIVSSFFTCFSCSPALSRSMVMESVGAKTQVTSLVNVVGLTLVLLFIAPLFETLPYFVLAAIILVSLRGVARQFLALPHLYHESKYDFAVWIVACAATVITNAMYGLIIGCCFTILTVIWRIRKPYACSLGLVSGTLEYQDMNHYADTTEFDGIKIFRYDGPLYFVSSEHFRTTFLKITGIRQCKKRKQSADTPLLQPPTVSVEVPTDEPTPPAQASECPLQFVIMDCSGIAFMDPSGIHALQYVINQAKKESVKLLFAGVKRCVFIALEDNEFFVKQSKDAFFINVGDAVAHALRHKQTASA